MEILFYSSFAAKTGTLFAHGSVKTLTVSAKSFNSVRLITVFSLGTHSKSIGVNRPVMLHSCLNSFFYYTRSHRVSEKKHSFQRILNWTIISEAEMTNQGAIKLPGKMSLPKGQPLDILGWKTGSKGSDWKPTESLQCYKDTNVNKKKEFF